MALGPPIVGMPHPAMAGPASVVQAMWGNLTVLGVFQGLSYRVSIGLVWECILEGLSRAILRYQGAPMGRLWHRVDYHPSGLDPRTTAARQGSRR